MGGYYAIGLTTDPQSARSLGTAVDAAIPFVPITIYLYAWVYTAMLYPLFTVRSIRLFRRVVLAYSLVLVVSLVTFRLFPVTSLGFRPDPRLLQDRDFHDWGVRLNFSLDPPFNLFPSLHLSIATLVALTAWKARPAYGALATLMAIGIAIAVLTLKQHYVVDGLAGIALGSASYAVLVRPLRAGNVETEPLAYGWAGPTSYFGFHLLVILSLYILYRAGVRPWQS
jgi:membrane-associated phospholipid phosphatase